MSDPIKTLPIQELRKRLSYNPENGELRWRERPASGFMAERDATAWNARWAGETAGRVRAAGHRAIRFTGLTDKPVTVAAHRVAWAIHYGEWPDNEIDHINGVRDDNRLCNLRSATRSENQRNQKLFRTNKSGVCGVYQYPPSKKWLAVIYDNGRCERLGRFDTKEEAIAARKSAERRYGYSERHGTTMTEPSCA